MSDTALKRIEKAISRLADQQNEICERIAGLEARAKNESNAATTQETLEYLDQFRAGEALGEAAIGAWCAVSTTPCLKGGLRTIQMREGSHARLLEERIKELGGSPAFEIPEAIYENAMNGSAATDKSDAEKVLGFVAQFPDRDAALKPISDFADRLDHDQETQSLLRTILQDERSTLEWLMEACAQLNPS